MIKKILLWIWGIAASIAIVVLLVSTSGAKFGDAIVSNTPTWYTLGIKIGTTASDKNVKVRAIISSSTQVSIPLLGPYGSTTSTTSTTMTIPYDSYDVDGPISIGTPCVLGFASSSTEYPLDGQVTAVSTTAQTATVNVQFQNFGTTATTTATGTLSATCFNTPF